MFRDVIDEVVTYNDRYALKFANTLILNLVKGMFQIIAFYMLFNVIFLYNFWHVPIVCVASLISDFIGDVYIERHKNYYKIIGLRLDIMELYIRKKKGFNIAILEGKTIKELEGMLE